MNESDQERLEGAFRRSCDAVDLAHANVARSLVHLEVAIEERAAARTALG